MLQVGGTADPQQIGPFVLLGQLGSGGMGRVFLGRSPGGRLVAIKVVSSDLAHDPRFRRRFAQEITAMRRVGGFWTAAVVDADPQAPVPWLATEYVPGPSLTQAIREHGPLPANSTRMLARGLAEALAAIHAAGLTHRDLKPSNVLLATDGPRVIDFGIARALEDTALTGTGQLIGTPGFVSPEQARCAPVGPPSDIFCLGLVLAYATTGTNPFGTGGSPELLYRVVHEDPDLTGVPAALFPLIWHCLARPPAARPTPAQLLAQLGRPTTAEAADWLPASVTRLIRSHAESIQEATTADPPGRPAPPAASTPAAGPTAPATPRLSRRHLLIGIAGTAALATAGITGWQLLNDGNSPSGKQRTPPTAAPRPGRARWTSPLGEDAVSLAVAKGTVYAGGSIDDGQRGSVFALDAASGKQRWKTPAEGRVDPLAVAGGTVYFGPNLAGSGLFALDASSGKQRWKANGDRPGWSVDCLAVADSTVYLGNSDYFGGNSDAVIALDAASGNQRWTFPTGGNVSGGLAVANGNVYAALGRRGGVAVDAADGTPRWKFPASGWILWSLAVADGTVCFASTPSEGDTAAGTLFAVDAASGKQRWKLPVDQNGVLAATGRTVYAATASSATSGGVVAVDTASGSQRWAFPTGKPVNALSVVRGTVYAGSGPSEGAGSGAVFAVDAASGNQRWKLPTDRGIKALAVADGMVYAATGDAVVAIWA
ncbi:serine/threonine-protein kinase [Streptomyces sp. NPDC086549]|uniref:serine/threonine-protein kinase n=1 Tax=Streptomyces sp. NPDC086549 TaxID=3365752 RepID=UPI003818DA6E